MTAFCRRPPDPVLLQGVAAFNARAYWECHHLLEPLWLCTPAPERDFFKGLIQVAGGLYHVDRGNRAGAVSLLGKGPAYLKPFSPCCQGVAVDQCRAQAEAVLDFVLASPPDLPLPTLPRALRPQLLPCPSSDT